MTQPFSKTRILKELRTTRQNWERLLLDVDSGCLPRNATVGEWSVKGVLYHATQYADLFVRALEAHSRGEPPPPEVLARPAIDERNADHFRQSELRTLNEVVADSRRVFDRLLSLVEQQPDYFLVEPQRFPGVSEDVVVARNLLHVCDHYRAHMSDIGTWKSSGG